MIRTLKLHAVARVVRPLRLFGFLFAACCAGMAWAATPDLKALARDGRGWEVIEFPRFANSFENVAAGRAAIRPANLTGAYVADLAMADGTIEVEVRGQREDQSGFIGVLFGGVDARTYECVYFRPFNFGHEDAAKRRHAVQYVAMPEWPWQRLRRERTDEFEKPVHPEPQPDAWFRARIVVAGERVRVYVNDAAEPSLDVRRLTPRLAGKVGIFINGVGDLANFKVLPARQ